MGFLYIRRTSKLNGKYLDMRGFDQWLLLLLLLFLIIIIIIIIINIISFMQGIYTYIPETNYVPREYSVAAICCYYSWCLYR